MRVLAGALLALSIGATTSCAAGPSPLGSGPPSARANEEAPRRAARPPWRLCARELAHLEDNATFVRAPPEVVDGKPVPAPSPSELAALRDAPPLEPARRVVLEDLLPPDYVIEAIVLPNFARLERIERPRPGEIARIDRRGAHGDVVVLVRRALTGGLYDYVGACEIGRSVLAVAPHGEGGAPARGAPRAPSPPSDVTIRVSESGGAVYVDVVGGDLAGLYLF
ncbi:MAG: hypothetical protein U0414_08490 [Polyangiaceae bacterium]